jgi:hypothetical protein
VPKKAQITQKRVEYNVFLFDEPLKGSKSLKIFKISLTFRFDKLSNLSKSVHRGENSQILTVEQKIIKSDRRSKLNDVRLESCVRVAVSSISANIDQLMTKKQCQISH